MASEDYDLFLDRVRSDERVLGLVLTGSRGRGVFVRPESDWDVRLIVQDDALAACGKTYATPRGSTVEVAVFSLGGFENAGAIGSANEWDRYSYVHANVVLDKLDGQIVELVAEKSVLPADVAGEIAARDLDTYINSYYRSAKNLRNGLTVEAHLDAVESSAPLLTTLFAFYQRVRPFNKFLRWELVNFPLGSKQWSAERLLPRLEKIAASGDLVEQQALFCDVEQLAREHGCGDVVDGWEPDVGWLRGHAD